MNLINELIDRIKEHKERTYTSEGEYSSEVEYEEVQHNQLTLKEI